MTRSTINYCSRLTVKDAPVLASIKCLTVIDEYTRECLAIDVAGDIRSRRVIEGLSQLVSVHGAPKYLQSDNRPEFVSRAILKWQMNANIDTALSDPGKPSQNGSNESFNGGLRDECLSMEWFPNRMETKIVIRRRCHKEHRAAVAKWSSPFFFS